MGSYNQQQQQPFDPALAYQQQQQQNSFYGSFHGQINYGAPLTQLDPQFMQQSAFPNGYGHMMIPYNPYTQNQATAYYEDQPEIGGGDSIVPPPPMVQAPNGEMVPHPKKHKKKKKKKR